MFPAMPSPASCPQCPVTAGWFREHAATQGCSGSCFRCARRHLEWLAAWAPGWQAEPRFAGRSSREAFWTVAAERASQAWREHWLGGESVAGFLARTAAASASSRSCRLALAA